MKLYSVQQLRQIMTTKCISRLGIKGLLNTCQSADVAGELLLAAVVVEEQLLLLLDVVIVGVVVLVLLAVLIVIVVHHLVLTYN